MWIEMLKKRFNFYNFTYNKNLKDLFYVILYDKFEIKVRFMLKLFHLSKNKKK
jgi:hypothetical protein